MPSESSAVLYSSVIKTCFFFILIMSSFWYLITLWTQRLWIGKTCFLLSCSSALAHTFNPRAVCKQELNKVNDRSRGRASNQLTGSEHKKTQERERGLKTVWRRKSFSFWDVSGVGRSAGCFLCFSGPAGYHTSSGSWVFFDKSNIWHFVVLK